METGKPSFYLTDVFGKQKYGGGQLATFVDSDCLSDQEMQQIAYELNFPETTFITSRKPVNEGYNVRIFTPNAEVDFAGHPTLGTAYIIRNHIMNSFEDIVKLNLKVGQIPVRFSDGALWMEQMEPEFGKQLDTDLLAKTLSLEVSDFDEIFPIQELSTGLPFTIVPLKSMEALKRAQINIDVYNQQFTPATWAKGILIFARNKADNQTLRTRVFVNYLGIPEDPATGSASGCLAGYLLKHNYLGNKDVDIKIGQGYEINRPSEISLRAFFAERSIRIQVGGAVELNAQGTWHPSK